MFTNTGSTNAAGLQQDNPVIVAPDGDGQPNNPYRLLLDSLKTTSLPQQPIPSTPSSPSRPHPQMLVPNISFVHERRAEPPSTSLRNEPQLSSHSFLNARPNPNLPHQPNPALPHPKTSSQHWPQQQQFPPQHLNNFNKGHNSSVQRNLLSNHAQYRHSSLLKEAPVSIINVEQIEQPPPPTIVISQPPLTMTMLPPAGSQAQSMKQQNQPNFLFPSPPPYPNLNQKNFPVSVTGTSKPLVMAPNNSSPLLWRPIAPERMPGPEGSSSNSTSQSVTPLGIHAPSSIPAGMLPSSSMGPPSVIPATTSNGQSPGINAPSLSGQSPVSLVLNGLKGILQNIGSDNNPQMSAGVSGSSANPLLLSEMLTRKSTDKPAAAPAPPPPAAASTVPAKTTPCSDSDAADTPVPEIKTEWIDLSEGNDEDMDCEVVSLDFSKKTFVLPKNISRCMVDLVDENQVAGDLNTGVKIERNADDTEYYDGQGKQNSTTRGVPVIQGGDHAPSLSVATSSFDTGAVSKPSAKDGSAGSNAGLGSQSSPGPSGRDADLFSNSGTEVGSSGTADASKDSSSSNPNVTHLMQSLCGFLTTLKPNNSDSDPPSVTKKDGGKRNRPSFDECEIVISDEDDGEEEKDASVNQNPDTCESTASGVQPDIKKEPSDAHSIGHPEGIKENTQGEESSEEVLDAQTWQALKSLLSKTLSRKMVSSFSTGDRNKGSDNGAASLNPSETQDGKEEGPSSRARDALEQAVTSSTKEGDHESKMSTAEWMESVDAESSRKIGGLKTSSPRTPRLRRKCGPKSYKESFESESPVSSPDSTPASVSSGRRSSIQSSEKSSDVSLPANSPMKRRAIVLPGLKLKLERRGRPRKRRQDDQIPYMPPKHIKISVSDEKPSAFKTVPIGWNQSDKNQDTLRQSSRLRGSCDVTSSVALPVPAENVKLQHGSKPQPTQPLPKAVGGGKPTRVEGKPQTSDMDNDADHANTSGTAAGTTTTTTTTSTTTTTTSLKSPKVETNIASQVKSPMLSPVSVQSRDSKSSFSPEESGSFTKDNDDNSDSDSSLSEEDNESNSLDSSGSSDAEADLEYRCKLCSKSFQKKSHFKKHMKVHYSGDAPSAKPAKKVSCKACRRKFGDKTALQAHLLQRKYCFYDCTRVFWKKRTGSMEFCKMCGKGAANWKDLKKHCYKNLTCRLKYIDKVLDGGKQQHKTCQDDRNPPVMKGTVDNQQQATTAQEEMENPKLIVTGSSTDKEQSKTTEPVPVPAPAGPAESDYPEDGHAVGENHKHTAGLWLYTCGSCKELFDKSTFRKHLNVKSECRVFNTGTPNQCQVELYFCHNCDISMQSGYKLLNHKCLGKEHVVKCQVCLDRFSSVGALSRHMASSKCGKKSKLSQETLNPRPLGDTLNIKSETGSNKAVIAASSCSPSSVSGQVAGKDKQIECFLCPSRFDLMSDLLEHSHTHSADERIYQCSECHMTFNRYNRLVSHKIWHRKKTAALPEEPQPCNSTQPPFNSTQPPFNSTQPPFDSTQPPFNSTQPPFNSTQPPCNSTQPPFNSTQPQFNSTQPPLNSTQPPLNSTQPPFDSSQPPQTKPVSNNRQVGVIEKDKHVCKKCGLAFDRVETLKFHILTHKPFEGGFYCCPICPIKYDVLSMFKDHVAKHKKALEKKIINALKVKTRGPKSAPENKKETLAGDDRFFSCSACDQKFPTLNGRHDHLESSVACRRSKVEWDKSSGKAGNEKLKLKVKKVKVKVKGSGRRLREAKKNKPAANFSKCSLCSAVIMKASFRHHLRIHVERMRKSLTSSSKHSHATPQDICCEICGRKFSSIKELLLHLTNHKAVDIIAPEGKTNRQDATFAGAAYYNEGETFVKNEDDDVKQEPLTSPLKSPDDKNGKSKSAKKIAKITFNYSCKLCHKKVYSIPAFKLHLKISHKNKMSEGWSSFLNYTQADSDPRKPTAGESSNNSCGESSKPVKAKVKKRARPIYPSELKRAEKVACHICHIMVQRYYLPHHVNRVHGISCPSNFSTKVVCHVCRHLVHPDYLPQHMERIHGLERSLFFRRRNCKENSTADNFEQEGEESGFPLSSTSLEPGIEVEVDWDDAADQAYYPDHNADGHDSLLSSSSSSDNTWECRVCLKRFQSSGKLWRHQFRHIVPCSVMVLKLKPDPDMEPDSNVEDSKDFFQAEIFPNQRPRPQYMCTLTPI